MILKHLCLINYIIIILILTQITIASVTIYLHRYQAHHALILHPLISHFFRFWLWLTTGMITSEWVAVHRKHHANTDIIGDPHSPQISGLKTVVLQGAELYRKAIQDSEMINKYSHNTPNDWIERNLYSRFSSQGIILMFCIDIILFGFPGISIWSIQMLWIPFHAAGIINGIGHYFGYRNFACGNTSTNIFPIGIWIGGEELHNNHHAFIYSAKFSIKWWEFDIGWLYIKLLSVLQLAKVKKLPPKLIIKKNKFNIDLDTVKSVIRNRFQIMAKYYKQVVFPIIQYEKSIHIINNNYLLNKAYYLICLQDNLLSPYARINLTTLLNKYENLRIVYNFRRSLQDIWLKTSKSQIDIIRSLQMWCKQAENSKIQVLYKFAQIIKNCV